MRPRSAIVLTTCLAALFFAGCRTQSGIRVRVDHSLDQDAVKRIAVLPLAVRDVDVPHDVAYRDAGREAADIIGFELRRWPGARYSVLEREDMDDLLRKNNVEPANIIGNPGAYARMLGVDGFISGELTMFLPWKGRMDLAEGSVVSFVLRLVGAADGKERWSAALTLKQPRKKTDQTVQDLSEMLVREVEARINNPPEPARTGAAAYFSEESKP